jgi:hypothetical protein
LIDGHAHTPNSKYIKRQIERKGKLDTQRERDVSLFLSFIDKTFLHPSQNISKSKSKKFNIFDLKFRPNTFTYVDQFLLIFYNGWSI